MYGGLIAYLADLTMGSACYTTLGPGDVFATLDLNVRFMRPALIYSGDLTCRATVQHKGKRMMIASCEITNAEGKRVAMATESALIVRGGALELAKGRLADDILGIGGGTSEAGDLS